MKKPNFEFNAKKFYSVGKYCFFISGVIGVIRIIDLWNQLKSYDIVGSAFSTIFQFALFAFFAHLSNKENIREVNDGDIIKMEEALRELNLGGTDVQKTDGKKR